MTSPSSPVDSIAKAMEGVTPGPWDVWEEQTPTKAEAIAEMAYQVENSEPFAEVVYLLNANGKCPATTGCGPTSAANAAYIAACSPDRMREVLALARQAEAMKQRAEAAEALAERLKLEAQAQAMEARTANSTINAIYQVVSGGIGEPGNWHGAGPVRDKLEAMERENDALRSMAVVASEALTPFAAAVFNDNGDMSVDLSPASSDVYIRAYFADRRARALIGGGNAED